MAHKKRITYKEFIEEQMVKIYKEGNPDKLRITIWSLLEGIWDQDTVAQVLREKGRTLVRGKIKEKPLTCPSCSETLYTLVQVSNEAVVYRISKDGDTLYLKEETRLAELSKLEERKCPNCSETLNLSRYRIEMVD